MSRQERNRHSFAASAEGIQRVKAEMARQDWSREELVEKTGLAKITVDRFFSKTRVELSTTKLIAHVLQLPLDAIIEQVDKPSANQELYVHRPEEGECHDALERPGAVVRVKAPQLMGKTWFLSKVLTQLSQQIRFRWVEIDIDRQALSDIDSFFCWLCTSVSIELELPVKLDEYRKSGQTPVKGVTTYFQEYILPELIASQDSLLLVLDKFNYIFEAPAIMHEFSALLRNWAENSIKGGSGNKEPWAHFRLVIVYATDIYGVSDDIHYSPLSSIGKFIELREFDQAQVEKLAECYGLSWNSAYTTELMKLVGGHPYLVDIACNKIKYQKRDVCSALRRIIETGSTVVGPYANHLLQLTDRIEQSPDLNRKFAELVNADQPIVIEPRQAFKLYSMGLIKQYGESETLVEPRCHLYQKYFFNYYRVSSAIKNNAYIS